MKVINAFLRMLGSLKERLFKSQTDIAEREQKSSLEARELREYFECLVRVTELLQESVFTHVNYVRLYFVEDGDQPLYDFYTVFLHEMGNKKIYQGSFYVSNKNPVTLPELQIMERLLTRWRELAMEVESFYKDGLYDTQTGEFISNPLSATRRRVRTQVMGEGLNQTLVDTLST